MNGDSTPTVLVSKNKSDFNFDDLFKHPTLDYNKRESLNVTEKASDGTGQEVILKESNRNSDLKTALVLKPPERRVTDEVESAVHDGSQRVVKTQTDDELTTLRCVMPQGELGGAQHATHGEPLVSFVPPPDLTFQHSLNASRAQSSARIPAAALATTEQTYSFDGQARASVHDSLVSSPAVQPRLVHSQLSHTRDRPLVDRNCLPRIIP